MSKNLPRSSGVSRRSHGNRGSLARCIIDPGALYAPLDSCRRSTLSDRNGSNKYRISTSESSMAWDNVLANMSSKTMAFREESVSVAAQGGVEQTKAWLIASSKSCQRKPTEGQG